MLHIMCYVIYSFRVTFFEWRVFHIGGYCPVGICPGVFVQGVYVLEPFH